MTLKIKTTLKSKTTQKRTSKNKDDPKSEDVLKKKMTSKIKTTLKIKMKTTIKTTPKMKITPKMEKCNIEKRDITWRRQLDELTRKAFRLINYFVPSWLCLFGVMSPPGYGSYGLCLSGLCPSRFWVFLPCCRYSWLWPSW